jgi:putative oxidoreductase
VRGGSLVLGLWLALSGALGAPGRLLNLLKKIFAFQIIAGALLLVNRYVPLAVALLAPVIVNILSFHALMAPSGLPLALFVAVLWAVIFVDVRPAFTGLFQSRLQPRA